MTIGKIERPFGVRGEVKVRSLSDVPGRFEHLNQVQVVGADGASCRDRTVTHVRRAGDTYIVRFEGMYDAGGSRDIAWGIDSSVAQDRVGVSRGPVLRMRSYRDERW